MKFDETTCNQEEITNSFSQHVEGDSTKLAKDMKKIIMALLYIL